MTGTVMHHYHIWCQLVQITALLIRAQLLCECTEYDDNGHIRNDFVVTLYMKVMFIMNYKHINTTLQSTYQAL